ncbi:uncharacterized protein LOC142022377 [Carettochelys insculpta]|uniref:uncharacterized protein LOC142022377 n=1 Tax=Carettochelys insculpta TaxID=44489 RepID=UPI003EBACB47
MSQAGDCPRLSQSSEEGSQASGRGGRRRAPSWSALEIKDLLALWAEEAVVLDPTAKRYNAPGYARMAKALAERSHPARTLTQVRAKVKELRQGYVRARDVQRRLGPGSATCPYYRELDHFLGGKDGDRSSSPMDSGEHPPAVEYASPEPSSLPEPPQQDHSSDPKSSQGTLVIAPDSTTPRATSSTRASPDLFSGPFTAVSEGRHSPAGHPGSPKDEAEAGEERPVPPRDGSQLAPAHPRVRRSRWQLDEDTLWAYTATLQRQKELTEERMCWEDERHRDRLRGSEQWLARVNRLLDITEAWVARPAPPVGSSALIPLAGGAPPPAPAPPDLMLHVMAHALQWAMETVGIHLLQGLTSSACSPTEPEVTAAPSALYIAVVPAPTLSYGAGRPGGARGSCGHCRSRPSTPATDWSPSPSSGAPNSPS